MDVLKKTKKRGNIAPRKALNAKRFMRNDTGTNSAAYV
jgi:hypothetical protein